MNPPVVNDVFKFLAVRPPQRVSDKDTHQTIIRDARAADPAGARGLAALANDLARPEGAMARWQELDLSALAPLIESHGAIARRYEKLSATDAEPDGRQVLQEAGVAKSVSEPRILRLAWDALFIVVSLIATF
jgi:hypothetical protein